MTSEPIQGERIEYSKGELYLLDVIKQFLGAHPAELSQDVDALRLGVLIAQPCGENVRLIGEPIHRILENARRAQERAVAPRERCKLDVKNLEQYIGSLGLDGA